MNKLGLVVLFLISAELVSAATIYGNIYDLSLNKVDNVRIEINTAPRQNYIAKNGTYSFNVPLGDYSIRAVHYSGNIVELSTENISVKGDGGYVLDMVLFPSFEEEKELLKETGVTISEDSAGIRNYIYFIAGSLLAISASMVAYLFFSGRKPHKAQPTSEDKHETEKPKENKHPATEEHYDTDKIIAIIRKEGGRATQKEIRKLMPLSEAKVSLMISELEAKGAIKKIKKGRGNILILNK